MVSSLMYMYTNVNNELFVCFLLQIVQDYMYKTCTCTGSGTTVCSTEKACQMVLPTMDTIAEKIREKYDKSVHSRLHTSSGHLHRTVVIDATNEHRVSQEEMIHFSRSPEFCKANPELSITGVAGRDCTLNENKTSSSHHCNNLCCDHGYETYTKQQANACNCKFVWCCHVQCGTCYKTITRHKCR